MGRNAVNRTRQPLESNDRYRWSAEHKCNGFITVDTSRDTALLAARERKHEFDPKGI
jgi:hypothetical protein